MIARHVVKPPAMKSSHLIVLGLLALLAGFAIWGLNAALTRNESSTPTVGDTFNTPTTTCPGFPSP